MKWLTGALFATLAFFALGPVVALLIGSSGEGWLSVWSDDDALRALRGTLTTSAGASLFAFVIGVPLAVLIERTDLAAAKSARALLTVPAAIPPYIWAMGWVALANPRAGLLNLALGIGTFDIYGAAGIALVLGSAGLPLVVLPTCAALSRVDASLEEAARLSGASVLRTLISVPVPLALPSALSGAALVFLASASSFGVPYLLGVTANPPTPTLTTRLYSEVLMGAAGLHRASVLSVELLALAVGVLLLNAWLSRRASVRLAAGKGVSRRPLPLGRARVATSIIAMTIIIMLIIMPLGAVFLTSVQPTWGQLHGLTFGHWSAVLSNPRTLWAAARSVMLSFCAATLVTLIGLSIASTRRKWLETIGDGIFAIPGTVFALALIVSFSRDLRFIAFERIALVLAMGNTLWLLLVGYVAKHLAYGIRNSSDGFAQLDGSLVEAARLAGASRPRAFFDAVLPQLRKPLAAAFVLTFLTCMTELTVSVLLIPTGSEVLGTLVFELQSYADPASAAVIACALIIMTMFAMAMNGLTRNREAR